MVTQRRALGPTETRLPNRLAADGQIIFSTAQARAALGEELVALHLIESPKLDQHITTCTSPGSPEVEQVSYARDTVWLDKAQTRGFRGVPEAVWHFHIGGYQVCDKWLKDRKGRVLSSEDIEHYRRIVDGALRSHGQRSAGWRHLSGI